MEFREQVVYFARGVVGLGADPKSGTREQYLHLIAPIESAYMQDEMAKMSGCALTVAGIWRLAGIKHQKIDLPYRIGTAVSRLVTLAHKEKAWVPYDPAKIPGHGDMVLVGDNGAGGVEHVYTVTDIDSERGHPIFGSVDGGQRDADSRGFQVIRAKHRIWKQGKDIVFKGTDPGASTAGGRRIYGWIDITKLEHLQNVRQEV